MNEKLVERVARALAVQDGIQICSDASYAQSSYRSRAQAAIAAHSAFIREAVARDDVLRAGERAWMNRNLPDPNSNPMGDCFRAMLDQTERTPDEG